jgi:hypothetical protein
MVRWGAREGADGRIWSVYSSSQARETMGAIIVERKGKVKRWKGGERWWVVLDENGQEQWRGEGAMDGLAVHAAISKLNPCTGRLTLPTSAGVPHYLL